MSSRKFNSRGFTSFLVTLSFIIMTVTGLMLLLVPQGKIAYWTNWTLLGLSKTHWGDIHTLSSFQFMIAGFFHIYFNWKPLINYIRKKTTQTINLKYELIISTTISILIVIFAIYRTPPFNYIYLFSEYMSDTWIVSEDYEPPVGHAEQLSLKSFCSKQKINLKMAVNILKNNNIKFEKTTESMGQIALNNDTSPMQLYIFIKHLQTTEAKQPQANYTLEWIEENLTGTGMGNKDINFFIKTYNLEKSTVKKNLKNNNLDLRFDQKIKQLSEENKVAPLDIAKIILLNNFILNR